MTVSHSVLCGDRRCHVLAVPPSMQNLSSPTRDRTCTPCSGSTESEPLDQQASPQALYFRHLCAQRGVSRHLSGPPEVKVRQLPGREMEGQEEACSGEPPSHPCDTRGCFQTQSTDVGTELKEVRCQQVTEPGLNDWSCSATKLTLHSCGKLTYLLRPVGVMNEWSRPKRMGAGFQETASGGPVEK